MITQTAAREIAKLAIESYLYFEAETDASNPMERAIESFDGDFFGNQPTIVCLCGSTRFYDVFQRANFYETMAGKIVLSVGFYPHSSDRAHSETVGITPAQKERLDQLHMRKIDAADEVLVLNVGGYIGESTARELAYARQQGKRVRYWEPGEREAES